MHCDAAIRSATIILFLIAGCKRQVTPSAMPPATAQATPINAPPLATQPAAVGNEIHKALQDGNSDQAIALLTSHPELIEFQDRLQQTPLHAAVYSSAARAVTWLIGRGANVNAFAYNRYTPLHLTKDGAIATELLKAGADTTLRDSWGKTPLQRAADEELIPVVDAILSSGVKLDLLTAIILKKRDVVRQMLKENPEMAREPTASANLWGGSTPLAVAAGQRDLELVRLLLDAGADVNQETYMPNAGGNATALTNAVWGGDVEIVKLLLARGARTNVVGGKFYPTILDYAQEHSTPEIVALLKSAPKPANQ